MKSPRTKSKPKPHPEVSRAFDAFCKAIDKHPRHPSQPALACTVVMAPDAEFDSYKALQELADFCVELGDTKTILIHAIVLGP